MIRRTLVACLSSVALLLNGCTSSPPPSQPNHQDEATPGPPGWQYITSSTAELYLKSVSPDRNSFLLMANARGNRENDLLVTLGDQVTVSKPTVKRLKVETPGNWRVDIIELPWETIAVDAGSELGSEHGVASPDLRYAAIASADGLWLGDLATGEARRITTEPGEWTAEMGTRNPLIWARDPHWTADSKWIYFDSNRLAPYSISRWRIAVDGGAEELVEHEVVIDDDGLIRDSREGPDLEQQIQADGFHFRGLSPDRKWAAANKEESSTFRLYNLEQPEKSITYTYHADRYAGAGLWSPDSSKLLFRAGPVHDPAGFIGVLDVTEGGHASLYAFPDPLAGLPSTREFIQNDLLLVSTRPWNSDYTEAQWGKQTQWWLLDLKKITPLEPQEPTRLVSAKLYGTFWAQAEQVTGGATALVGAAPLTLRFDRPVSAQWLTENVVIEGSGAELETYEALLGLATVRIHKGSVGEEVRVQVPKFDFDLTIRRTDPLSVNLEVRQGSGPWQTVDPMQVIPRTPLELRFRFNHPVDEAAVAHQVEEALLTGWHQPEGQNYTVTPRDLRWEDGALLLYVDEPVPLLAFSLMYVRDKDGQRVDEPMRVLRTGTPPVLVARGERDEVRAEVPVEIQTATLSADGKRLSLSHWEPTMPYSLPSYELHHSQLDLVTGHLTPGEAPELPAPPETNCQLPWAGHFRTNSTGKELLYSLREPWGTVIRLDLATCEEQDLGPGLPVGWTPDERPVIIRWEDSKDHYAPDYRYNIW